MRQIFFTVILFSINYCGLSQNHPDFLYWSATNKLTVDDFGIKKNNSQSGSCFAQFSMECSVTGFDFMTKKFNKKVRNAIIKTASWIDTTYNVDYSLRYQQTLFDLAEIYTRRFRKELRENRKQIAKGLAIVEELNSKISADFAKRRLQYDSETKSGTDNEKQLIWEDLIRKELQELDDYSYDN